MDMANLPEYMEQGLLPPGPTADWARVLSLRGGHPYGATRVAWSDNGAVPSGEFVWPTTTSKPVEVMSLAWLRGGMKGE